MNKSAFLILCLTFSIFNNSNGQNPPIAGEVDAKTVYLGSGPNFVLIPSVWDGDENTEDLVIEANSSDPSLIEIISINYFPGSKYAEILFTEKGKIGDVILNVNISDADGIIQRNIEINIRDYDNYGIGLGIYDIAFYKDDHPIISQPVWDTLLNSITWPTHNPDNNKDSLDYASMGLTVGLSLGFKVSEGFTAMYKGYLIPPATGDYNFTIESWDWGRVYISEDEFHDPDWHQDAAFITNHHTKDDNPEGTKSLIGGKVYAIAITYHCVYDKMLDLYWEGPGIDYSVIGKPYLRSEYDIEKPLLSQDIKIVKKGDSFIEIQWNEGTDNKKISYYNVYLDGKRLSEETQTGKTFLFEGLSPDSVYSVVITAVDQLGNESLPESGANITTYPEDTNPPSVPVNLSSVEKNGLGVKIMWDESTDSETEVLGYYVYLENQKYNEGKLFTSNEAIIKVLTPSTDYNIQVTALDAGSNESDKSEILVINPGEFNPDAPSLGIRKGRMLISNEAISFNQGIGVNHDYFSTTGYSPDEVACLDRLDVGALRWGAIPANSKSLSENTGNTGQTYGKFMNLCNQLDAYTVICCGVHSSTDWRANPQTFLNFLEYIAGPETTEWGKKRADEGYPDPLLDSSKGLIFEFGNEVWGGGGMHMADFSSLTAYGDWAREMAELMKTSPYYDPEKITLVYSCRGPSPDNSWGQNELVLKNDQGHIDWIAVTGYLEGNMDFEPSIEGDTRVGYYQNGIEKVADNINGLDYYMKYTADKNGGLKSSYLYESNMTKSDYNGRLGQAIVNIDYYLTAMEHGSALPTIFHLTVNEWKITLRADSYRPLPLYEATRIANANIKGHIMSNSYYTLDKIYDADSLVVQYEPVGTHAYYNENGYSIVLVSRDFENDHYVEINLPSGLNFNTTATQYTLHGESYDTYNAIVDTTLVNFEDKTIIKVAPYSMILLNFEGDDPGFEPMPLGFFKRVLQTGVSIDQENPEVTTSEGRVKLTATVTPEDAFSKGVIWQIVSNQPGATISNYTTYIYVRGSGLEDGNGTVKVRAVSVDDPEIFDEVDVTITNQVTSVKEEKTPDLHLYPNPAQDQIMIELPSASEYNVKILDSSGRILKEVEFFGNSTVVNVHELKSGYYFVKISRGAEIYYEQLLKY
jgi:alpha-L-arabinofuranosidase